MKNAKFYVISGMVLAALSTQSAGFEDEGQVPQLTNPVISQGNGESPTDWFESVLRQPILRQPIPGFLSQESVEACLAELENGDRVPRAQPFLDRMESLSNQHFFGNLLREVRAPIIVNPGHQASSAAAIMYPEAVYVPVATRVTAAESTSDGDWEVEETIYSSKQAETTGRKKRKALDAEITEEDKARIRREQNKEAAQRKRARVADKIAQLEELAEANPEIRTALSLIENGQTPDLIAVNAQIDPEIEEIEASELSKAEKRRRKNTLSARLARAKTKAKEALYGQYFGEQ